STAPTHTRRRPSRRRRAGRARRAVRPFVRVASSLVLLGGCALHADTGGLGPPRPLAIQDYAPSLALLVCKAHPAPERAVAHDVLGDGADCSVWKNHPNSC